MYLLPVRPRRRPQTFCGSFFAININSAAHHEPQMWYNTNVLSRKEVFYADD